MASFLFIYIVRALRNPLTLTVIKGYTNKINEMDNKFLIPSCMMLNELLTLKENTFKHIIYHLVV